MLKRLLGAESDAEPGDPALIRADGTAIEYRTLEREVAALAQRLIDRGAGPGVAVAIGAEDPARQLIAALAAWEAGAAVVPLNLSGGWPQARAVAARVHVRLRVREAAVGEGSAIDEHPDWQPIDPRAALVLFTSGSSGPPKGVLLGGAGLRANVEAILGYLPVRAHRRTALTLPLVYSYALVGQALTTLRAGGALLLLGPIAFPPLQLDAMVRLQAEGLSSVPAVLRLYARAIAEGAPRPRLAYLASAGAPLDGATAQLVRDAFPGAKLFNQYGLTEASPRVAAIDNADPAFARGAAGRPLPGISVWAEEGELYVRGPSVMLGYLDDPEATARALREDGALRTGDRGWVDETGAIFVTGRADGVVKVAGERVGLDEVAVQLREAGARDAAVVGIADEGLGAKLVAFVELPDAERREAAVFGLRLAMRERLSPARRPWKIVAVDALPRLPSGKIDRVELQRRAEQA